MSININKAQQAALADLGNIGDDRGSANFVVVDKVMLEYAAAFKLEVAENIRVSQLVASGKLSDNIVPEITEGEGYTLLQIRLLDYYDYPNEGVRGFKSSANAPKSPYKFKNAGIGTEMRRSLTDYVRSGRAKISSVSNDKARGIGLEKKGIALSKQPSIDQQVSTLGYLIKAYGIKSTNYFTKAFDTVFKDFEFVMAEAIERDIVITLNRLNR